MTARVGTPIGNSAQNFKFAPWSISVEKGAILNSLETENLSKNLGLPQLPEMTFGKNKLGIHHANGFAIEFDAIDALRRVDNKNDLVKVAVSREWLESRKDCEYIHQTVRPFDWTYTTDYRGTIHDAGGKLNVKTTEERIDMEKLKVHEKIAFFEQVILFEDELADHGCAELSVKVRVMGSCFFLLMRFFLRVDGLLARIYDTRLYHECGKDYLLREYCEKEGLFSEMQRLPPSALTDAHKMDKHLRKKKEMFEKLSFNFEQTTETKGSAPITTATPCEQHSGSLPATAMPQLTPSSSK